MAEATEKTVRICGVSVLDPDDVAPPLVCKNCGKEPHQHIVRKERLTCPGMGGSVEWEYTDDRRAWDILQELDGLDARRERLTNELAKLTDQPWSQEGR